MTNLEFSNEFDVLYNNITSNQAPGLDEYEKSVFLTKAQDELIKAYFNPKTNKVQEGFDDSQKRQIDFSMIVKVQNYGEDAEEGMQVINPPVFDQHENSRSVALNDDIMMVINEFVTVDRDGKNKRLTVVPVSFLEYSRLTSKPYGRPLKNQAWRLLNSTNGKNTADLIVGSNDSIRNYSIRYVKRPRPIILSVLSPDEVSLGGGYVGADSEGNPVKEASRAIQGISCELDPMLHPELLQRAVELAKASYTGDLNSQIVLGQTSQTNMGIVTQSR